MDVSAKFINKRYTTWHDVLHVVDESKRFNFGANFLEKTYLGFAYPFEPGAAVEVALDPDEVINPWLVDFFLGSRFSTGFLKAIRDMDYDKAPPEVRSGL